jgi:hypothetical protein
VNNGLAFLALQRNNVKNLEEFFIFILVKHSILVWRFRVAAGDFGFRVYTTPIGLH